MATAQTSTTGPAERLGDRVAEQHDARDRVRHLEVDQVIRDEERVQRPVAHLVQVQIVLLLRVGMLGQAVDLRQRRADDVVDDPAELADLVDVVELADLHHVAAVFHARATCRAAAP